MISVKADGRASDKVSGVITKAFEIEDEYGEVEPNLSDFGQTIKLESWRDGRDWDGRVYTIKVWVEDLAGNINEAQTKVTVPHSRR
jgi:hypothetical protein